MHGHDHCDCPLSATLRAAIRRGWRGLAVIPDGPGGRVRLACAVPADDVDDLAAAGLAIGLPPAAAADPRGGPRRMMLALVGDASVSLTLDLGFADAREMVSRIGTDGALDLVWAGAEDGRPRRMDVVGLSRPTAERLRTEAALQGEWRLDDPAPDGFAAREWEREATRSSHPRLARGGRRDAAVVVIAPVGDPGAEPSGPPDIELDFPAGPPVPEATGGIRIRLADARQRALAEGLRHQESVTILLVDDRGRWLAQVDLALGPDSRRLIADAAHDAARREAGDRRGTPSRPPDGGR